MGRALSEIVSADLAASPDVYAIPSNRLHSIDRTLGPRPVSAPGISTERPAALLAGAAIIGYGDYFVQGGTLHARMTLQDARTNKTLHVLSISAPAADIVQAAGTLARDISPRAGAYGTRNAAAVRAYALGLESNGPAAAPYAQQAIAADPNFGPPYVMLANVKLQQQDRSGALDLLDRAHAANSASAAQIELERATLRNDQAGRLKALEALAQATPGDPEAWQAFAELAYTLRQYPRAVAAYQKALTIEPANTNALNQLAYAATYAGNLELGLSSLRRYEELRPKDPNPVDSTGDVNLIAGRLDDATKSYLAASKKQPGFLQGGDLLKAAISRLMAGDLGHANDFARQYTEARAAAHDPAAPQYSAEWLWLTGRHQDAYRALTAFAKSQETAAATRDIAARAYAEIAMWNLLSGDREAAAQSAQKSASLAGPGSGAPAILARFLAQPSASAAEWNARAAQLLRNPGQEALRQQIAAYALLFDKQFAPAGEIFKRLIDESGAAAGEGIPVLLAWCDVETGRLQDAAPLLHPDPIPPTAIGFFPPTAPPLINTLPLYFPRLYQLRAQVEDRQGNHAQAEKDRDLYRQLSATR